MASISVGYVIPDQLSQPEIDTCSSRFITVIQEQDPNHFQKIEDFPVQKLVHSLAVDTSTHRVYAPEQQEDGKPAARIVIYEAAAVKRYPGR